MWTYKLIVQFGIGIRQWYADLEKHSSHPKILGARKVTCSKFRAEGPQILGATVQNSVARATWLPAMVHPLCKTSLGFTNDMNCKPSGEGKSGPNLPEFRTVSSFGC
jgi:hypothetical protein